MKPVLKTIVILSLSAGCSLSGEKKTNSAASPKAIGLESRSAKAGAADDPAVIERETLKKFAECNATLSKMFNSHSMDWDAYERAVRAKINDFPTLRSRDIVGNVYGDMMTLMWHYERRNPEKTGALAREVIGSSAPERFKSRAKGYLRRMDALGRPLVIQFTAPDGREADSTKMRGKVVLVDFWSSTCPGCIRDLPKLKAAYDKFHVQGFEIIGICCDTGTDKKVLQRFVTRKEIPGLQFFESSPEDENRFVQEYGICHIPHMMLLDKEGCLREDNVEATSEFETKVARLLAE